MKKFLKIKSVKALARKNFKFVTKKYASKYLIFFLKESYPQSWFFYAKALSIHQGDSINLFYRFVLNNQFLKHYGTSFTKYQTSKICTLSGRTKGHLTRFRLARTTFRKIMTSGLLVGERKSSF